MTQYPGLNAKLIERTAPIFQPDVNLVKSHASGVRLAKRMLTLRDVSTQSEALVYTCSKRKHEDEMRMIEHRTRTLHVPSPLPSRVAVKRSRIQRSLGEAVVGKATWAEAVPAVSPDLDGGHSLL
jgi:hypothetical protein